MTLRCATTAMTQAIARDLVFPVQETVHGVALESKCPHVHELYAKLIRLDLGAQLQHLAGRCRCSSDQNFKAGFETKPLTPFPRLAKKNCLQARKRVETSSPEKPP